MEAKGDQLMHEAEQHLKKGGGLFGNLLGISSDRYEEAGEKFGRAGHAFKAAKAWASSARAYQRAAECYTKAKSESEAANSYIECARAYIKAGDGKMGTEILETQALPRMVDAGRLTPAAKLHQDVGKMFEDEGQHEEAIRHYQSAADFFNAENSPSSAQKCLASIGLLSAQLDPPDFKRAAEVFEQVGSDCLGSNLMKFSAKGYFFNSVLCTLAMGDVVAAELALNRFKDLDYTFEGARECKLLADVIQSYTDGNDEAFTDAVYNFDQISKLDPWRTSLLLKIKKAIQGAAGGARIGGGGGGGGAGGLDIM